MCKVLKVHRSGYYAWLKRPKSNRNPSDLDKAIASIFRRHKGRAGSEKISEDLAADWNMKVSHRTVRRSLKRQGLRCAAALRFKSTTDSDHNLRVAPNRVNRNFNSKQRNRIWVSDITYIRVGPKWFFLCIIIDLYNRKVVGWSFANHMRVELLLEAYNLACQREKPGPSLIFHSDRGSQYAAKAFRKALIRNRHFRSMSRKGNCWDNAVAESFFRSLKVEMVYRVFLGNNAIAQQELFEYIELYYNTIRRHASLGYMSPAQFSNMPFAA